ncbi:MAG: cupin domain-containing protein [Bacteroidota bacterium]
MEPVHAKYSAVETLDFPGALTLKILLVGAQTDGQLAIFEDLVQPGIGAPRHIHHEQDETFFFLEGQFDVEIGGELHHMEPGDVAVIPKGTIHAFKNVGDSVGRLRYIFSPALSIEEMFRDFYQAQQEGDFSAETMAAIAAKHGQEMVGPPI